MSEVKVNKISPRSGTDVALGDASDTFTLPASATIQVASSGEIDIASGATLDVNGTLDVTGATVTGLSAITHSSFWHLTSSFTGDVNPIASNLSEMSYGGYTRLGSAMTESSGVFTFPETGIWLITFKPSMYAADGTNIHAVGGNINTTVNDGSSWVGIGWTYGSAHVITGSIVYAGVPPISVQFDVTDTSTHKVSFKIQDTGYSTTTVQGDSNAYATYMTFLRLGDT